MSTSHGTHEVQIAILEDETILRQLLVGALSKNPNYKIVVESGDGNEGLKQCMEQSPQILILDLLLPGLSGLLIVQHLLQDLPETRILILSSHNEPEIVVPVLRLGVCGFVNKQVPIETLQEAVDCIANGGSYFSPGIAPLLQTALNNDQPSLHSLSKRELEILQLLAEGNSSKQIADRTRISVRTVDHHRANIMKKLGLHDAVSLARYAIKSGLTSA